MPARKHTKKCPCRCGQAPAETTRLRKSSCPCGASIIRLSRQSLATVAASCSECGHELSPDCLFDRIHAGGADAERAIAELETRQLKRDVRNMITSPGRQPPQYRCGDCQRIRKAHGPCKGCGSTHAPTTTYMHPRAARMAGGDWPF